MAESYVQSAKRLFKAAETLIADSHHETAGHLYGLSAECAIKYVLIRAGINIGDKDHYRHHLPKLAQRLRIVNRGRALRLFRSDPSKMSFRSWNIEHRYSANGDVSVAEVSLWQADARAILRDSGIPV